MARKRGCDEVGRNVAKGPTKKPRSDEKHSRKRPCERNRSNTQAPKKKARYNGSDEKRGRKRSREGDVTTKPAKYMRAEEPLACPKPKIKELSKEDWSCEVNMDDREKRARFAVRVAFLDDLFTSNFRIDAILGFGSSGVAVRARLRKPLPDFGKVRTVAIKICYKWKEQTTNRKSITKFFETQKEDTMLRLANKGRGHANVIEFLGSLDTEYHRYIVTELVGSAMLEADMRPEILGTPITAWNTFQKRYDQIPMLCVNSDVASWINLVMARNPPATDTLPPLPICQGIFAQAASGIRFLYGRGIAHRDIKEDNVLLGEADIDKVKIVDNLLAKNPEMSSKEKAELAARYAPRAVITDLGLALNSQEGPPQISVYGARLYWPPELHVNLERHPYSTVKPVECDGFKADVFALGLFLYTLLHGRNRRPMAARLASQGLARVKQEQERIGIDPNTDEYPLEILRDDLDPECEKLLKRMLNINPSSRASMEEVMQSAWVKDAIDAANRLRDAGEEVWGIKPAVKKPVMPLDKSGNDDVAPAAEVSGP
ncbi:hypothetical protein HDU96_003747, partial [Phlyctochytrium bullatum]